MRFFMPPSSPLFLTTLILGTLLTLSSNSWIFIWMGLELNLLSFIPLLSASSSNLETSSMMKYFLTQAMASGLLLLFSSIILFDMSLLSNISTTSLMFSLMIKAGMPPCHFWLPSVMSNLNWFMCTLLATWQKIAPISLLIFLCLPYNFITISMLVLGLLISAFGGLNQTQSRAILAYSSIGHMSWMITASLFSPMSAMIYLSFYIIISLSLFLSFLTSNLNSPTSKRSPKMPPTFTITIPLLLMSLGGLPPLTGFIPKWMILETLILQSPLLSLTLILSSTINLAYYLNLSFATFSLTNQTPQTISPVTTSISYLATFTLISLPMFL